ncbi:hypothetical protein [Luteipulveratus halotolerans]|uniref:hypothetical protein n=1 Tax=Luteipulveratus halotolerans TaxID=1631356 RepID=UPI0008FBCD51|nr:hypothetical protein [Luteipulveratus halotolerans]
MSIATLLGHFGIDVPRYIAMDGQVVIDGVTQESGGGYIHATHRSVTPVATHTFHGGEEEPLDVEADSAPWWQNSEAIGRHVGAMKHAFPGFAFMPPSDGLPPCWIGDINTGRGTFTIGVFLRYDEGLPIVKVLKGGRLGVNAGKGWVPSEHLYLNGNLCIADRSDWKSAHTAATATAWAAHWLAAFTEWRITRRWPVEGFQPRAA